MRLDQVAALGHAVSGHAAGHIEDPIPATLDIRAPKNAGFAVW